MHPCRALRKMTSHCIQEQEPLDLIAVQRGDGAVHLRRPDVRTVQQLRHFQDRELPTMRQTRVSFLLAELFHSCLNAQHAHQRSAPSCPLCRQGCELALPPRTQQGQNAWCQVCLAIAPDVSHHIQERLNPANSFVQKLPMCPWPFKTASVLAGLWRLSNSKVTAAT